jgi:hypothetical protein
VPERYDPPVNGTYTPFHNFDSYDFHAMCPARDRLNQGPFGVEQDDGWHTLTTTVPARGQVRNFGMGLIGYPWEENGAPPVPGASLEETVSRLASLPFCDKLYIRIDWRDVQKRPGRLDLHPVFPLTLALAKEYGLHVGIRIQMSSPNIFPELAMPKFLASKIPFVDIGPMRLRHENRMGRFKEPAYHHPRFQKAFRELNELMAAQFDGNPLVEWIDLMEYGLWGEGHTGGLPKNSFPDFATALETWTAMTRLQLETWKHTPLAVNTQPDISRVGNNTIIDMCIRAGEWMRTDSILEIEESQQVEMLSNRPPYMAAIVEDGGQRRYEMEPAQKSVCCDIPRNDIAMLHSLDVGATHWALWQMGENLARYYERFPYGIDTLESRIGYRVRPSWIWRRKRYNRIELIVGVKNDGVAGVPGILRLFVEGGKKKIKMSGSLDPGQPFAGKVRQASFLLPEGVDYEGLTIRAEIEVKGVSRPVKWACEDAVNKDGSLPIVLTKGQMNNWRKDR